MGQLYTCFLKYQLLSKFIVSFDTSANLLSVDQIGSFGTESYCEKISFSKNSSVICLKFNSLVRFIPINIFLWMMLIVFDHTERPCRNCIYYNYFLNFCRYPRRSQIFRANTQMNEFYWSQTRAVQYRLTLSTPQCV